MINIFYILSCQKDGGIYRCQFKEGEIKVLDKTPLDRPMYAIIREDKLYVILREIDTVTRFGGIARTFTNEGKYYFVIRELAGKLNGVYYDDSIYRIAVTVTDDGEGYLIPSVTTVEPSVIVS